jgi:hypothetical protein
VKTEELKNKLRTSINEINDLETLLKMEVILDSLKNNQVYHLTEEQIALVEESRLQYNEGVSKTDDEVNREEDKWLKE